MLAYYLFRFFVFFLHFIPFSRLSFFSFFFRFLSFSVLRIRRKQVSLDVKACFPNLISTERLKLEKKIHFNACLVFLEAMKSYSMTKEQIKKHVQIKNPETLEAILNEKKSCLIYFSHFGNWEWLSSLGVYFPHKIMSTYKRIHNPKINSFVKRRREIFSASMIEQKKVLRSLVSILKNPQESKGFIMIGDQRPKKTQEALNIEFLGRSTSFLLGTEKLSKKLHLDVLFMKMKRLDESCYEISFEKVGKASDYKEEGDLTRFLAKKLEAEILSSPESWFWMHNRWKK